MVTAPTFPLAFNLRYDPATRQFLFTAKSADGTKKIELTSTPVTDGTGKHHIFVSVDLNHAAGAKPAALWIDGADALASTTDADAAFTMGVNGSSIGIPLSNFSKPGGPRHTDGLSAVDYSNIQVWLGQYIDPTATSSTSDANDSQAEWLRTLVDAAKDYGLDPLIMLTFANIESGYKPLDRQPNGYSGLFAFSQSEMQAAFTALGATATPDQFSSADQLLAFLWFYTGTGSQSGKVAWAGPVVRRPIDDPTGIYHYLVHNQGGGGFNQVLNALRDEPTKLISSFPIIGSENIPHNLMNQAWVSKKGVREGLPLVTKSSTITQWWNNLTAYYTLKQTTQKSSAQNKLNSVTRPNIEYFYNQGAMRIPPVAQSQFGVAEILLWGKKADFITGTTANNDGLASDFTVVNPSGVTDVA